MGVDMNILTGQPRCYIFWVLSNEKEEEMRESNYFVVSDMSLCDDSTTYVEKLLYQTQFARTDNNES